MKKYSVVLNDKTIIFRELNLGEWNSLRVLTNGSFVLYAHIVELAVIEPAYSQLRAGEILYLGEKIFKISSKFADDAVLEDSVAKVRSTLETSVHIIPTLICSVFPAYTPEMVLEFDFDTLVIRLAQVQWLNDQNNPKKQPAGVNELQIKSIDNSHGALERALKAAKQKGATNV